MTNSNFYQLKCSSLSHYGLLQSMFRNRVTQIIRAASSKPEKIFSSQLSKLSKGEKLTQELQVLQFDEKRDLFRRNRKKRVQTRDLDNQFDLLQNLERRGIIRNHWPLHEAKKINQWVNNHARKIVVVFDVSKPFTIRDAVSGKNVDILA